MITGYIGIEPFSFFEGNLEVEQYAFKEVTEPFERGRAFSREASRTKIATVTTTVDLVNNCDRRIVYNRYVDMIGTSFVVKKRIGNSFEDYFGLWMVTNLTEITNRTYVALGSGGLNGGQYILTCRWSLSRVDIDYGSIGSECEVSSD